MDAFRDALFRGDKLSVFSQDVITLQTTGEDSSVLMESENDVLIKGNSKTSILAEEFYSDIYFDSATKASYQATGGSLTVSNLLVLVVHTE